MNNNLITLVFVFFVLNLYGQDGNTIKKIENIDENTFQLFESLIDKNTNEVFGHFVCYQKNTRLMVDLLDTDLNFKKKLKVKIPRNYRIIETLVNDETILICAGDTYGSFALYTFTLDGDKIKKRLYRSNRYLPKVFPSEPDNCYFIFLPARGDTKRSGYKVQKIDKNLKVVWKKKFIPDKKGTLMVETAEAGDGYLAIAQIHQPKRKKRKVSAELLGLNSKGDTAFLSSLTDGKYCNIPSKILFDADKNFVAVGQFYKKSKQRNIFPKGVFIKKVSLTGENINFKKYAWEDGVKKYLTKSQMALSGSSRLFIHDLIQVNDTYQMVCETYSVSKFGSVIIFLGRWFEKFETAAILYGTKVMLEAKLTGRYIGGGSGSSNISAVTTQDIVLFNFNSDINLQGVQKIAKDYTKVYVFGSYAGFDGLSQAKAVADRGFFDYVFTAGSSNANRKYLMYNASYITDPHIGFLSIGDSTNNSGINTIKYRKLEDEHGNKGSRNMAKKGLAGAAQSNNGNIVVYYYMDNKEEAKKNRRAKKTGTIYFYLEDFEGAKANDQAVN